MRFYACMGGFIVGVQYILNSKSQSPLCMYRDETIAAFSLKFLRMYRAKMIDKQSLAILYYKLVRCAAIFSQRRTQRAETRIFCRQRRDLSPAKA